MSGYREDNFDLGEEPQVRAAKSRRSWKIFLVGLLWVGPNFWLMDQVGYPDSFGVHYHSTTGKGQTFEDFYYSYLLLERHHPLDVITFAWMWAPFIGAIIWVIYAQLRFPEPPAPPSYADHRDLEL